MIKTINKKIFNLDPIYYNNYSFVLKALTAIFGVLKTKIFEDSVMTNNSIRIFRNLYPI